MNEIFDRKRLAIHRDRSANKINDSAFLLELSVEDLEEKLKSLEFKGGEILEVGARNGLMTQSLLRNYPGSKITATDISKEMLRLNPAKHQIVIDDEDIGSLEGQNFDAIVSVLNLHHLNDVKKFFTEVNGLLKVGGVFVASMFAAGSLFNLRRLLIEQEIEAGVGHMPHIYPFAQAQDIYKLLQLARFKFIVTDTHKIELEYDSPLACMREVRRMGESSCLINGSTILSRRVFEKSLTSGVFIDHVEILTLTAKA